MKTSLKYQLSQALLLFLISKKTFHLNRNKFSHYCVGISPPFI